VVGWVAGGGWNGEGVGDRGVERVRVGRERGRGGGGGGGAVGWGVGGGGGWEEEGGLGYVGRVRGVVREAYAGEGIGGVRRGERRWELRGGR